MKPNRWHLCNVLDARQERRELWQFARDGHQAKLASSCVVLCTDPLPAAQVKRTLRNLWQLKVNTAWLPAGQAFLRVLELPPCNPKELAGMIELQIEKLSPVPLAQTAWTFHPLPCVEGQSQTVIVIVALREVVEKFLGNLEGAGFMADRLELPQLQELLANAANSQGVWLYPREEAGRLVCLAAWWHEDRLRNLNLLALPPDETAGAHLVNLLKQLSWAGEVEGWLTPETPWRLIAEPSAAGQIETELRNWLGDALQAGPAQPLAKLAAISAESTVQTNLVPPEQQARYRQQFIDRLWMRGLGVVALIYLFGVLAFFAALHVRQFQKDQVDEQIQFSANLYTNALQLKAKVQVLQEQVNLKFAALDCLRAASEALPEELKLEQFNFQGGKRLGLFGQVPADQQSKVTAYNQSLSKATANGQPLFSQVTIKSVQAISAAGGSTMRWNLECQIKRSDL